MIQPDTTQHDTPRLRKYRHLPATERGWRRRGAPLGAVSRPAIAGLWALLLCTVSITATAASSRSEAEDDDQAREAIIALWSTLDQVWDGRDAERFSELFTVDGSFDIHPSGQSVEGRAAIRQHYAQRLASLPPELRHHTSVGEIRTVAPTVRTVDGRVEILRHSAGDTAPTVISSFTMVAVMLETPEGWRIRVLRAYQLPAAAEADDRSAG